MTETTKLTVRLPATLHHRLVARARRETSSLNHLIVDALSRSLDVEIDTTEASDGRQVRRILRECGLIADLDALPDPEAAEILDDLALLQLRSEIGQLEPSASMLIVRERDER